MSPKKAGKALLCLILEAQVKQLRRRNKFIIVAVVGSVGKTSTKLAIANLLVNRQRVIYQDGNYNDRLTVPLILFGQTEPGIFNIIGWLRLLLSNQRILRRTFAYDVAVLELGTDRPGELSKFAYLKPDLTVITAVAPEHMEYFSNLDGVAKEELTPLNFSEQALLNLDDIASHYLPQGSFHSYGQNPAADFKLVDRQSKDLAGQHLEIRLKSNTINVNTPLLGQTGAKIIVAAAGVADLLGWTPDEIKVGFQTIKPVNGRMKVLAGVSDSTLIDDTYNSSPIAAKAALDVLYQAKASQRICILGSMNELGQSSAEEHRSLGAYCQADKLELVVTIGTEAEKYLAPAASENGCEVKSFDDPYSAGEFVKQHLKTGAVILAKGSQNHVFAEEALKVLLRNPSDVSQLVRQSAAWLKIKKQQFPSAT